MSGNISRNPDTATADQNNHARLQSISTIPVGGLTPFTTIDFPGRLAGVFYLQGCPWRCRYCHNSEFWPSRGVQISSEKILQYLLSRRGKIDGIVFSGGEPTQHWDLPRWMETVRSLGYEIALHTNGMFPDRLRDILTYCSWVGLDVKAPFDEYEGITQVSESGSPVKKSIELLVRSGLPFECRTTVHPKILSEKAILAMARDLQLLGVKDYHFQKFRREGCVAP